MLYVWTVIISGRIFHKMLATALALSLARSSPIRCGSPGMAMEPDLSLLAKRMDEVSNGVIRCNLLVLDAMVPGQKLSMTAPPELVHMLTRTKAVVMLGRHGEKPHSTGVECQLLSVAAVPVSPVHPEGTAKVVLSARRLCNVVEVFDMPDGRRGRWLGRPAAARFVDWTGEATDDLPESEASSLQERCDALTESVGIWLELVRKSGSERTPGHLDAVLADLGAMPTAGQPSKLAFWVAGLINPLPALGVASECRAAVLMAPSIDLRLRAVERALSESIARLSRASA